MSNLFGRPALRKQVQDRSAQTLVEHQFLEFPRVVSPALRPLMGRDRTIGDGRGAMSSQLARLRCSAHDAWPEPWHEDYAPRPACDSILRVP